ncbi:MAG: patatin-like phospholipase family protein [Acidobacteriota bacterium]
MSAYPEDAAKAVDEKTATEHALDVYTPQARRSGIALCLSGGGFRASLFHLGALRRLNETGILRKTDVFSSVSGGSILAGHLARCLKESGERVYTDWEETVAAPFRQFTSKNIRTFPILSRLLPWNWFTSSTAVRALASRYAKDLISLHLKELPEEKNFIFCATDMAYGVNWIFERTRAGDYEAGYMNPPDEWLAARAIAASSCFPPVFNPLPINIDPVLLKGGKDQSGQRDERIRGLRLTDGGNYDNLGLEPVWKTSEYVLVSDGGAVFDFEPDKGLFYRLSRYTEIQGKQSLALRKRWLIAGFINKSFKGAYWGIGSAVKHYDGGSEAYSEALVDEVIRKIRTDLDAFSEAEACVLENHGYLLAEAAISSHLKELVDEASEVRIPHPEWMDEKKVREHLKDSHKRKLLGRW